MCSDSDTRMITNGLKSLFREYVHFWRFCYTFTFRIGEFVVMLLKIVYVFHYCQIIMTFSHQVFGKR